MATRRKAPEPQVGLPQVDPLTGMRLLNECVQKGRALVSTRPLQSDQYDQWTLLTKNYLEKAFGAGAANVSSVMDVGRYGSFPMNAGEKYWENHRVESLTSQISRLEGLIELLQTEAQLQSGGSASLSVAKVVGHRVFLVHGHDAGTLQQVARFLEKLRQDVVILHEQPNGGRTIIEKFEEYADVGFAVVLLTPDDIGGPRATPHDVQKLRARQNVILELGYFIGRLGRSRVCALYVDGVEIPSDFSGVLYVGLDSGGAWRLNLAKELKAAGLPVDMNAAL
jgi:predicted nucleotide-binding protein